MGLAQHFTHLALVTAAGQQNKVLRRGESKTARLVFPRNARRLRPPACEEVANSSAGRDVNYVCPSESSSVFVAMMKSFRCRPPILCVHQVTVTLPHSFTSAGWCPSSSACSPTLLVNANAWAKLRNLNTRSKRLMPSRFTTCHSGTCRRSSAISASVSVGSSPRQAVHFISDSSLILSTFL